jgi:hypothetical protein
LSIEYGGQNVEIDTNVQLEELFEIKNMHNFEHLLHYTSRLQLNGVEIDVGSFRNFVIWYAEYRKASAAKELDPVDKRAP